jgi:hypothetical protein
LMNATRRSQALDTKSRLTPPTPPSPSPLNCMLIAITPPTACPNPCLPQPPPAPAAAVDYNAPAVRQRTTLLLDGYNKNPPMSEVEAVATIKEGVDPKAVDKVSSLPTLSEKRDVRPPTPGSQVVQLPLNVRGHGWNGGEKEMRLLARKVCCCGIHRVFRLGM